MKTTVGDLKQLVREALEPVDLEDVAEWVDSYARNNAYDDHRLRQEDPAFLEAVLDSVDSILQSLNSDREWTSYSGEGYGTVPRQLTGDEVDTVRKMIRKTYGYGL